jgi:hypothetical protein
MARKKSKIKILVITFIVSLAAFGGYTLYNEREVQDAISFIGDRIEKVLK